MSGPDICSLICGLRAAAFAVPSAWKITFGTHAFFYYNIVFLEGFFLGSFHFCRVHLGGWLAINFFFGTLAESIWREKVNEHQLGNFRTANVYRGLQDLYREIRVRDLKFMGIACISAIPVILKPSHSDFHCKNCKELLVQGFFLCSFHFCHVGGWPLISSLAHWQKEIQG